MPRFNTRTARARPRSPVTSEPVATGVTYEGAPGFTRDAKSQLYLLGVVNLGDDGFYENAAARQSRFMTLVRQVAVEDPAWIAGFLPWLRKQANLRTAPVVAAAEAVKALVDAGVPGGRKIIANTLARADEPGEFLAYWFHNYGRKLPWPVKRGLADACVKLYDEYRLMKYDTPSHGIRFADVLALTHPGERRDNHHLPPWKKALFAHAIDRRYGRPSAEVELESGELLNKIAANQNLRERAAEDPGMLANAGAIRAAGMTWEDVFSLAGNKVPKAALWEACISSMGYGALLKNLRNFDDAGISDAAAKHVEEIITDHGRVRSSGQLPMAFLAAYRNAGLRWAWPIEQALNHSMSNIPRLRGSTLILVDRSGSMFMGKSLIPDKRTGLVRADTAAIFGTGLAFACEDATLVQFGTGSDRMPFRSARSVLRTLERFGDLGGTNTADAVSLWYHGHDRVVILTDEQAWHHAYGNLEGALALIPAKVPAYTWSLGGYAQGHAPTGPNRHVFGGLTDASFKLITALEAGRDARWPWEEQS